MSTKEKPKQLLPLIGGKSLLDLAFGRLDGLVPPAQRWVCAAEAHKAAVLAALPHLPRDQYLGEPAGRDTLVALSFASAVIARKDRDAVIFVLTADHLIEPHDAFKDAVDGGFRIAESEPSVLVTFGIAPTHAATGFGYLRLGSSLQGRAHIVDEFREKPDAATAEAWVAEGPARYLWNSGMFVWKAATFLECVKRYERPVYDAVQRIADAWGAPGSEAAIGAIYQDLKRISVDFAVMERASRDPKVRVAAVPMNLSWKDVGSWPAFAETCTRDDHGNSIAAAKQILLDTKGTLVVSSDPSHLIAAFGCDDLVIVHTPEATLVCHRDKADELKKLYARAVETFGAEYQ
jgi:mannose-1-phosphate guanylyltransferase